MIASRTCRVAAIVLLLLGPASAATPPPNAKTLTRFHDPVIVVTAKLDVADRHTAPYRLYGLNADEFVPVPFQFDTRDADGDVVFGESGTVEDRTFDDNDELVFMAKDTGDRLADVPLPKGADTGVEIEVIDPVDGRRGWAYLLHFRNAPPPRSPVRYVTFDVETNQVHSAFYTMEYYPERTFFTGMRITPRAGGTGNNILDRMKIRVSPTFSLLLGSWSPLFTEEDFVVEIDGVKNGPVRAIRRARQSMDLGTFFPQMPGGTVYSYYYFSSFATPSEFSIPWLVLKALRKFRFVGASDFLSGAVGMTYWDAANPQGIRYTGHHAEPVITDKDHEWYVVGGRGGTCLHVFLVPQRWREWGIVRGTVFADDGAAMDTEGPEAERGAYEAGYSLLNLTNLGEAGTYDLNTAVIILPQPYEPGDEAKPLDMLKQPLRTGVRPIP